MHKINIKEFDYKMKKYIILDFGKVLAYPTTGEWFITPLFLKLINMDSINKEQLLNVMNKYNFIVSRNAKTLEDEYNIFYDFYKNVLNAINYQTSEDIIKKLANSITYEDDKYGFYNDIYEELDKLSKKYTLLLLSDNWPCAIRIMRDKKIDKYFKKVYISSIYGTQKKDGNFFDYPINDFNIKKGEAIFIDDNEQLLDVAVTKGLDVILMDRDNNVKNSKYKVIRKLKEID